MAPEDLHRPFVDEIKLKCEKCGEMMEREPYVIDTWFWLKHGLHVVFHLQLEVPPEKCNPFRSFSFQLWLSISVEKFQFHKKIYLLFY